MKKRIVSLLTCGLCALAMCLAIVGCSGGGSGGGTTAKGANMVGYWELTGGKADGEELTEDDIKLMDELGLNFILHLADDGSATLDLFGAVEDLTWDKAGATLSYEGEKGTLELSGDTLTFTADGFSYIFKKGDDSLADKIEADRKAQETIDEGEGITDGTDSGAVSTPIDPAVNIADDGYVTMDATAKATDDWGQAGITLAITNNSDKKLGIYAPDGSTAVDNVMQDCFFVTTVLPGASANEFLAFTDLTSVDDLKNIQLELLVYDVDTYEDLNTYTVTIP